MEKDKTHKHKKRFKIYNILCIVLSILLTYGFYMFMYGWAKGDGNDVTFTFDTFLILLALAAGFYVTLIWPGYLLYKILMMKDR